LSEAGTVEHQLHGVDVDGDGLSFELVDGPANGSVTINADGNYSFTASEGYVGEDSFTYRVTDEHGLSRDATMAVQVGSGVAQFDASSLSGGSLSDNNRTFTGVSGTAGVAANISASSGRYYYEIEGSSYDNLAVGWGKESFDPNTPGDLGTTAESFRLRIGYPSGKSYFYYDGELVELPGVSGADILGVGFDLDSGLLSFFVNGTEFYSTSIDVEGSAWRPMLKDENGSNVVYGTAVFASTDWSYAPPEGYSELSLASVALSEGSAGNDYLSGSEFADNQSGGAGDDILTGGEGDDTLLGGDGADQAIFSGNRNDYVIEDNGDGTLTVRDLNAADGDDGADIVSGVEELVFADETYSVDE
ncbi:cadherin-like domain-containing protein, partial [Thalassospira sp. HF15]|uniref:Ig-like domain-containing protein n=1 Tax=Thalassospira sp. HF15 TaxID=2722755 RepID=UPI001431EF2A